MNGHKFDAIEDATRNPKFYRCMAVCVCGWKSGLCVDNKLARHEHDKHVDASTGLMSA